MPRALFLCCATLVATTGCVPLRSHLFDISVQAVQSELDGTIQFSDDVIPGTQIDVVEVLDIERDENIVAYTASVSLGTVTLELEYADAEYEGDTTLTETITFLGQTFTVNADVESRLEGKMLGGKVNFGLFGTEQQAGEPGFVVGGSLGLQYMELTAEIVSTAPLSLREEDTERVLFPIVGAFVRIDQPVSGDVMLFLECGANGVDISNSDANGTFLDATARVGVVVNEMFTVGGGYRHRKVDFQIDDDDVDVDIDGPFVFAELRF